MNSSALTKLLSLSLMLLLTLCGIVGCGRTMHHEQPNGRTGIILKTQTIDVAMPDENGDLVEGPLEVQPGSMLRIPKDEEEVRKVLESQGVKIKRPMSFTPEENSGPLNFPDPEPTPRPQPGLTALELQASPIQPGGSWGLTLNLFNALAPPDVQLALERAASAMVESDEDFVAFKSDPTPVPDYAKACEQYRARLIPVYKEYLIKQALSK